MTPSIRTLFLSTLLYAFAAKPLQAEEVIFHDIRLMAADLVDELVYTWKKAPPFNTKQLVVLAEVNAPVGLDSRFRIMVENRLYEVLASNTDVPLELAHCTVCSQWVSKSGPKRTIISRAIDQPDVLDRILPKGEKRLALSLTFEAQARDLVLRAYLYKLEKGLPVVWAHTLSARRSGRLALRDANYLISWQEAKKQQQMILDGRDPIEHTTRTVIRLFNVKGNALDLAPLPYIEQSLESVPLPLKDFRAGITIGFASLKDSMTSWAAGGHMMWLVMRDRPSLIQPDLYVTLGAQYIRMRGPAAEPFGSGQIDVARLIDKNREPKASLVNFRLGFETHIKYRLGAVAFIEYSPNLTDNPFIERKTFGIVPYDLFGWGVLFRW